MIPTTLIDWEGYWQRQYEDHAFMNGFATMVLILDGNSEIGAHLSSYIFLYDLFKAFD